MANIAENRKLYLNWLASYVPRVYAELITNRVTTRLQQATTHAAGPGSMAGLGDDSSDWLASLGNSISNVFNTVVDKAPQVAQVYYQSQAASDLVKVNSQRAQYGLPPLNSNGVPITAADIAGNPSQAQINALIASQGGIAGVPTWLWIGLLGLGGVLLLKRA